MSAPEHKLKKLAEKTRADEFKRKVLKSLIACLFIILLLMYCIASMYSRLSSFSVRVDRDQEWKYGLSLSDSQSFLHPTSQLDTNCSATITNIDGRSLDLLDLGSIDGEANGDNYLCYTFYCRNTGKEILAVEQMIYLANATNNIENAIRVRVICTDEHQQMTKVDYAQAAGTDENNNTVAEQKPYPTKVFYSRSVVSREQFTNFMPGDTRKYTVIVWLEGNDHDCVDSVIGGEFKIAMRFSVVGHSDIGLEAVNE